MSGPDQTPQMPDDRELEEFLAGRGKIREAYRAGAQEQPSAAVDDTILQMAAKAAAETSATAARKPRVSRRWQPSLAAAAVVVLALGVFFQVKKDPVAERAVFAPTADALTQERATAQLGALPGASPMPSSEPPAAIKQKKALASADQAQRQKSEMKKEMAAASGAISASESAPAPTLMAAPAAEADSVPSLLKAAPESAHQNYALQDSATAKPASPPPAVMAGKTLRSAPMERAASVAAAPMIEAEPMASMSENDLWAQACSSEAASDAPSHDKVVTLKTPQPWRGLSVVEFGAGALIFAPNVSRESVLERLHVPQDAASACVEAAQKDHGLRLRCSCVKP